MYQSGVLILWVKTYVDNTKGARLTDSFCWVSPQKPQTHVLHKQTKPVYLTRLNYADKIDVMWLLHINQPSICTIQFQHSTSICLCVCPRPSRKYWRSQLHYFNPWLCTTFINHSFLRSDFLFPLHYHTYAFTTWVSNYLSELLHYDSHVHSTCIPYRPKYTLHTNKPTLNILSTHHGYSNIQITVQPCLLQHTVVINARLTSYTARLKRLAPNI